MKGLSTVDTFGGIDADADELLDQCFQDHEAYRQAVEHEKHLIVGRKGSGKTAIYRKIIRTRKYNVFSFGHTFADYPWQHHDLQAALGVPEEDRYTHSWRYLALLTVAKILLNNDQSQPWSEAAADAISILENFVVDSYGSRDPDFTQLFSPAKTLRVNPTLSIPVSQVTAGLNLERVPVPSLPVIVQDVNRSIADAAMKALNPEYDYYVCFDQLDIGFSVNEAKYAQRLIGLILAARDLSRLARENGKRLSIITFLRDDIYQILKFEDKNKITESSVSRIEWDSRRTQWTLKQLMERRFGAVLAIPVAGAWSKVFNEAREMPGRQTKYQHILDRTFRRPRDIIKFCNETLDSFKRRTHGTQFDNEDVIDARERYSEYLLRELDDEIFKHLPNYDSYLEILKSLGTVQFSTDRFEKLCGKRPDLADGTASREILRGLFEFSVIGYYRAGGGGGGSEYVWRYLDPRSRFDEAAPSFRVHPGFKEALGLRLGF